MAVIYLCLFGIVSITMGSVYSILGIPKEKRTLQHAENFLVGTTALFIGLIIASHFWPPLGWVVIVLGNLRILQIISLNLITVIFDFTPINSSSEFVKRARWHFVALGFSFFDLLLIFAYMFEFLNERWQVLNHQALSFVDYMYYALVTMATLGYGDLTPVTHLGRIVAMYEITVALIFIVFVVAGAVGRLQKSS